MKIYFSHDTDARNDRKLVKLRRKYKWEGIGLYWALIEMLSSEEHLYRLPLDYDDISYSLRVDVCIIKSIINEFELFDVEGGLFWSESLLRRMEHKDKKSEQARKAVLKRWENQRLNTDVDTDVLQTNNGRNTVKDSKEKKSKINKRKKVNKNKYLDCIYLSDEETKKLLTRYGKDSLNQKVKHLNDYLMSIGKPKKYKSHYHTILAWDNKPTNTGRSSIDSVKLN